MTPYQTAAKSPRSLPKRGGKEALLAEQREAKLPAILSDADTAIARQFAEEAKDQENTGYD